MEESKMKKSRKSILSTAIIIIILFISIIPVQAATNKGEASVHFKPVYITQNSYIQLNHVDIQPTNSGQMVIYTIEVFNKGHEDLSFMDYWTQIKTKAGTKYSV